MMSTQFSFTVLPPEEGGDDDDWVAFVTTLQTKVITRNQFPSIPFVFCTVPSSILVSCDLISTVSASIFVRIGLSSELMTHVLLRRNNRYWMRQNPLITLQLGSGHPHLINSNSTRIGVVPATSGLNMSFTSTSTPLPPSNPDFQSVFSEANKIQALNVLASKKMGFFSQFVSKHIAEKMRRKAAVLIPLCVNLKGEPCLLYTLRSLKLSKHRGEICFPGGVSDPEDTDEVATALRETQEELSIPKESIEIWAVLRTVPTATALMRVTPVLGLMREPLDPSKLIVNPEEVETAFTISFQHLCDPANWGHTQFSQGFIMPTYKNMNVYHPPGEYYKPDALSSSSEDEESANKPKDVRLWGLTAILTHVVLEAFLPNVYKRHIPLHY